MRDLFKKKLNISKGNFIAGLLIIGLVVMGGILLAHQNRYEPNNQIKNLSASRSQVYIKGKGYKLDKKQRSEHEKIEKARENLLKKKPNKTGAGQNKESRSNGSKIKRPRKRGASKPSNGWIRINNPKDTSRKPVKNKKKVNSKDPVIETSIKDGMPVHGKEFAFSVHAKDHGEQPIDAFNIKVYFNSKQITSVGREGTGYNYLGSLKKGENIIIIKAKDEEGRTATLRRTVWRISSKQKRKFSVTVKISAEVIENPNILTKEVKIYSKESMASALTRCMKESGIGYKKGDGGTVKRGFYLSRIYKQGIAAGKQIHPKILEHYKKMAGGIPWTSSEHYNDSLGEFDFTKNSGWVAYLDGASIKQGFSSTALSDGSVVHLRFTVNLGNDLAEGDKRGWW